MKPLIQIDDEIREMTDEEHERYLADLSETPAEEPAPEE